jgi:ParB-like chromosome segregation protein Spo0J
MPLNTLLPIADIRMDGGTQSRVAIDESTVDSYAESLLNGDVLPPPIVFFDGSNYWLADGFHRVHAAIRAKRTEVYCFLKEGTQREAILYAVGSNVDHGLRRTNADKRRSIELLLQDPKWRQKSDAWIADTCRVSDKSVAGRRADLGFPALRRRQGRPIRRPDGEAWAA